jgi:septal ring factor EnvC (AmiA/AmiB activator)
MVVDMSPMEEGATKADLNSLGENIIALIQQLGERIDQRFDALSDAVEKRFEAVEKRFEAVEIRLDRISDTLVGVQSQMAAMTRWSDRFDREHSATLATQAGQQRAIDELVARVARLESQREAS